MQIYFLRRGFFFFVYLLSFLVLWGCQQGFTESVEKESSESSFSQEEFRPIAPTNTDCVTPPEREFNRNWDLNAWLAAHPRGRSRVITTQSGQREPTPFQGGSLADWKREISQFRSAWKSIVGPIPTSCVPLEPQEEPLGLTPAEMARIDTISYEMKKVSYRGAHGERIPAFLLMPHHITTPRPAVLVMHQSLQICGKKEPTGVCLQGSGNLDFARDLAQRGFVVLAPDSIGYGERAVYSYETGLEYADAAPLLSRFPQASLMGLRISDVKRGVDFLRTLPQVNRNRIGMLGHSNGGTETLFNAAFDSRIRCAVSNAGPNLLRRETYGFWGLVPGIARWAGWAYLPAMAFFNGDIENLPIETHQLYAMVAPRNLFVSLIEDDTIVPTQDRIDFAMNEAERAFSAVGGNFDFHTIRSGITPQCRDEWGTSVCISNDYDRCLRERDNDCLARHAALGMTAACVARQPSGVSYYCSHELFWDQCRIAEGKTEEECIARFASVGMNDACIQQATEASCRRDHGWYPETENVAYPWLEACLQN